MNTRLKRRAAVSRTKGDVQYLERGGGPREGILLGDLTRCPFLVVWWTLDGWRRSGWAAVSRSGSGYGSGYEPAGFFVSSNASILAGRTSGVVD